MSIPKSVEIFGWIDGWSEKWNDSEPEEAREEILGFLHSWRSRSGQWLEEEANKFFPLACEELLNCQWREEFSGELQKLHFANHAIWHLEDEARRDDVPAEKIVEIKRGIDAINQQRNNQMENIDEWILTVTGVDPDNEEIPLHSEPPGLMLDRLSILSLKIYHYQLKGKTETLQLLDRQRWDLGQVLDRVVEEFSAGRRRFRIYRQCKTYNDPELNPALKDNN
ncbi:MAG: DUF4254 domain-containing protein [bacterium]